MFPPTINLAQVCPPSCSKRLHLHWRRCRHRSLARTPSLPTGPHLPCQQANAVSGAWVSCFGITRQPPGRMQAARQRRDCSLRMFTIRRRRKSHGCRFRVRQTARGPPFLLLNRSLALRGRIQSVASWGSDASRVSVGKCGGGWVFWIEISSEIA